jgi:hypothetical protein
LFPDAYTHAQMEKKWNITLSMKKKNGCKDSGNWAGRRKEAENVYLYDFFLFGHQKKNQITGNGS